MDDVQRQAGGPADRAEADLWVSPAALRAWCLDDPLLDWLNRFGRERGFIPDHERPGYDPELDFSRWITEKGLAFEAAVIDLLGRRATVKQIAAPGAAEVSSPERAAETLAAMGEGVPVISQAVLHDHVRKTFGAVDLLVRSDILAALFPAVADDELCRPATALGCPWHYRAIDIKYTTLPLDQEGYVQAAAKTGYVAQAWLYNQMLGALQGYRPPAAYLLGRGWVAGSGRLARRTAHCLDRPGKVGGERLVRGEPLEQLIERGLAWVRRLRRQGTAWDVHPPTVPELRPNLKNRRAQPWTHAVRELAYELGDITCVWGAGVSRRSFALAAGIESWRDARCSSATLGMDGADAPRVDAILAVNREADGPPVRPARVRAEEEHWRVPPPLEFYVDFETVNALDDDFQALPEVNATALIFMVGCGYLEAGEWRYRSFLARRLDVAAEAEMLNAWFAFMAEVRDRLAPGTTPPVIHWSPAETASLETAYNSARSRHPEAAWPDVAWFDFLKRVIKAEPVVVRGAMAFGLKAMAKALRAHGCIETEWGEGPVDGLGAMVAAWRADAWAKEKGRTLAEAPGMAEVIAYNETDCKVMMEVVRYLREHH